MNDLRPYSPGACRQQQWTVQRREVRAMPGWVTGVIATFVLSTASAYVFLRLRCKGTGSPFGPHARWWAGIVIVITAAVSTGLGMAAVAAGDHLGPAYIGLILPSGLW